MLFYQHACGPCDVFLRQLSLMELGMPRFLHIKAVNLKTNQNYEVVKTYKISIVCRCLQFGLT